jgi:hypothetical protein
MISQFHADPVAIPGNHYQKLLLSILIFSGKHMKSQVLPNERYSMTDGEISLNVGY